MCDDSVVVLINSKDFRKDTRSVTRFTVVDVNEKVRTEDE